MTRHQQTLRTAVEFSGAGLHSGEIVNTRVLPGQPDHGVEFVRTDLPDAEPVPAHIAYHQDSWTRSANSNPTTEPKLKPQIARGTFGNLSDIQR